jgi:hypothetical protein
VQLSGFDIDMQRYFSLVGAKERKMSGGGLLMES